MSGEKTEIDRFNGNYLYGSRTSVVPYQRIQLTKTLNENRYHARYIPTPT